MNNFLFATDFESDATGVFQYTTEMARKLNAKIIMFHAFGTGELIDEKEKEKRRLNSINQLKKFVEKNFSEDCEHIQFEYLAEDMLAFDAIPKMANKKSIDVVVMGMRKGKHSFREIFENTTLEVFLKIDCGILVIPEGFQTEKIRKIGCATDFKFKDITMLNLLKEIGAKLSKKTTIRCLHVFEDNEEESRVLKNLEVLYSIYRGRKGVPIHFEVESGKLTETIEKFAKENKLDLFVMNSHQRSTIGKIIGFSVTKSIARDIEIPLLILKDL